MLRRLVKSSISVPKCFATAVWCPSSFPSHTYRHCSDIASWKKRDEAFSSRLMEAMRAEKKTKDPPVPSDHVQHLSVSPESFTAALAVFEAYKKEFDDTVKSAPAGDLPRNKFYASFRVPLVMTCGPSGTGKTTLLALLAQHFEKTTGGRALRLVMDGNNLDSLRHEHDVGHELVQRLIHAAVGGGGDVRSTIGKIRRHVGHTPLNDAGDWKPADNDEWAKYMSEPKLVLDAIRTVLDMERSAPLLVLVDDLDKLGDSLVFGTPRDIIESALHQVEVWSFFYHERASEDPGRGVTYCAASLVSTEYPIFCAKKRNEIYRFRNQEGFFMPLPLVNPNSWVEWVEAHPDRLVGRHLLWIHHGNAGRLHAMKIELENQKKWSFEFGETQVTHARNGFSADAKKALAALMNNYYNPIDFISSIFWSTKNPVNYGNPGDEMKLALHFEATGCCALIRKEDRVTFYTHPGFLQALCRLPEMRASFHPRLVQHALQLTELLFHLSHGYTDSNKVYQRMMCELFLCRVMSAIKSEVRLSELLPHFDPSEKDLFGQLVRAQCRDIPEKKTVRAFPRTITPVAEENGMIKRRRRSRECSPMPDVEGPWFCCESLDEYNVLADAIIVLDLVSEFKNKRKVCLCLQIKEHSDPDMAVAQYRLNNRRPMYYNGGKITNKRVAAFAEHHHIVHVLITPKAPTEQMQPGKERTWERFYVSGRSLWAAHPCVEALLTYDDIQQFCPMVAFSGCDVRVALNASNEKLIKAEEEKPR